MQTIVKPAYNEEYRLVEFRRPDGKGQLGAGETVLTASVLITDSTGANVTGTMVDTVGPNADTQVIYRLFGGTVGAGYSMHVRITTSSSQQLEEQFTLLII